MIISNVFSPSGVCTTTSSSTFLPNSAFVLQKDFETISDPTDTIIIMKAFVTDMECYGAGGALVKREGVEPVAGGIFNF